jgi:hypothetical protein
MEYRQSNMMRWGFEAFLPLEEVRMKLRLHWGFEALRR